MPDKLEGLESWARNEEHHTIYYGVDRTKPAIRFNQPRHEIYTPPLLENILSWLRFRLKPTHYLSPSLTPLENIEIRILRYLHNVR